MLSRRVGGLGGRALLRFAVRTLLVVAVSTAVAGLVAWGLHQVGPEESRAMAGLRVAVVGAVDVALFLVLARLVRLREVTDVLRTLTRRVPAPQRD